MNVQQTTLKIDNKMPTKATKQLCFTMGFLVAITVLSIMLYDRNMSPGLFKTASVYTAISKDKLEQTTLIELTHNVSDVTNVTAATHNANQTCNATFKQSFEENLSYIQSYNLSSALPYMEILKLNPRPLTAIDQYNISPPVFVTGCSTNHFKENMQLMENIDKVVRPAIPDLKIVVFDFGLKHAFEIEQLVLQEYPFVIWMDSSVRFTTGDLKPLFDKAVTSGIVQVKRPRPRRELWIREQTDEQTFQVLNEPPCLYDRLVMVEAGFIAIYAKHDVVEGILKPWTMCALVEECMFTTKSMRQILKCHIDDNVVVNHSCHRYDQSVLNILMKRLYHQEMEKHLVEECEFAYFRNPARCTNYTRSTS